VDRVAESTPRGERRGVSGISPAALRGTPSLTSQWSRRPTASAPASLRLLGAAHRGRWVAAAQPGCLAWRREKADQARRRQATRTVSSWASPHHQSVSGSTAGEVPGSGRAATGAARWSRARERVRSVHHPACGAGVVVPGPSTNVVAGVVPSRAPTRAPEGSGAFPAPGGRAWRGRGAQRLWPGVRAYGGVPWR